MAKPNAGHFPLAAMLERRTIMKTTIAIIGAGPGLGLASARRFGAEGFNVALLSRTQDHVDALAAELADAAITARGYAADAATLSHSTPLLAWLPRSWGLSKFFITAPYRPRSICGPFLK